MRKQNCTAWEILFQELYILRIGYTFTMQVHYEAAPTYRSVIAAVQQKYTIYIGVCLQCLRSIETEYTHRGKPEVKTIYEKLYERFSLHIYSADIICIDGNYDK